MDDMKLTITPLVIKVLRCLLQSNRELTTTEIAKIVFNNIHDIYDLRTKDVKVRRTLDKLLEYGVVEKCEKFGRSAYKVNSKNVKIAEVYATITDLNCCKSEQVSLGEFVAIEINGLWYLIQFVDEEEKEIEVMGGRSPQSL